jgi:serine/threonine protein kinase
MYFGIGDFLKKRQYYSSLLIFNSWSNLSMGSLKRHKPALIDRGELLRVLEFQARISKDRLFTDKKDFPVPNMAHHFVSGHEGEEYEIERPIGIPGAFGAGWRAQRISSKGLIKAVNEVVQREPSKTMLLTSIEKLINVCKQQESDQLCSSGLQAGYVQNGRIDEVKINCVKKAVEFFGSELEQWKNFFYENLEHDESMRKACDRIYCLSNLYIQKAGFKSGSGCVSGVCYPCIEQLKMKMQDLFKMIDSGDVKCSEVVFLKTFYIPSEKFGMHAAGKDKYVDRVQRELQFVKEILFDKFSHENIAKIHDVLLDADVLDGEKKSVGRTVCVIQELVDGGIDLYEWVNDWRRDTHASFPTRSALDYPGVARHFFRKLMEAVAAMHDRRIFHYDIKIENIMVSQDSKALRLVDFGLGKVLRDGIASDRVHSIDAPEVWYLAPEVRGARPGSETVPEAADLWSCGAVLLGLTVREPLRVWTSLEALLANQNVAGGGELAGKLEARFDPEKHEDGPALKDLLLKYGPNSLRYMRVFFNASSNFPVSC